MCGLKGCAHSGFLFYNTSTQRYAANEKVNLDPLLNGFIVTNTGNTLCVVNGQPILPNDFKSFGGNRAEIYMGRLDITFQPQAVPVIPAINECYVTQKFYVPAPAGPKQQADKLYE
jgi:hypothetical protein